MKKIFSSKNIMLFIFFTFALSMVFVTIRIILAPAVAPASDVTVRVKSDYALMLLQSALGVFAMLIPSFLKRKINLEIPSGMLVMYAVFLFCAIYLGEVRAFYYKIPNWDTILHTFSGAALGAIGFSVVSLLNKSEEITFSLSPVFVALFAFCFALSLGTVWELYEFAMDTFFGTNMQKFALESGEAFIGQEAIFDTMMDFIVDTLGAFVMSLIGYISLKSDKGWLEQIQIKSK